MGSEIGCRGGIVEPAAAPVVERLSLVAPLFGEGVLGRGLERFRVLAVEWSRCESLWPSWCRRRTSYEFYQFKGIEYVFRSRHAELPGRNDFEILRRNLDGQHLAACA